MTARGPVAVARPRKRSPWLQRPVLALPSRAARPASPDTKPAAQLGRLLGRTTAPPLATSRFRHLRPPIRGIPRSVGGRGGPE